MSEFHKKAEILDEELVANSLFVFPAALAACWVLHKHSKGKELTSPPLKGHSVENLKHTKGFCS